MKTKFLRIAPVLLAAVICAWGTDLLAQATTTTTSSTNTATTATTVTTSKGAFTEFVPASETIVVRSETNTAPLRYVVTKQTTIVDEAGVPIMVEKISPGSPLSVEYTGTGDRLVASRIVVQKAPVVTDQKATTTTTTTTTRPLTKEEKKAVKEEVEKQKEKADEAKDKAEDDDE